MKYLLKGISKIILFLLITPFLFVLMVIDSLVLIGRGYPQDEMIFIKISFHLVDW